jgi:hypothetical protein
LFDGIAKASAPTDGIADPALALKSGFVAGTLLGPGVFCLDGFGSFFFSRDEDVDPCRVAMDFEARITLLAQRSGFLDQSTPCASQYTSRVKKALTDKRQAAFPDEIGKTLLVVEKGDGEGTPHWPWLGRARGGWEALW